MTIHKLYRKFLSEQTHLQESSLTTMTRIVSSFPAPTKLNGEWLRERSSEVTPSTVHTHKSHAIRFLKWWIVKDNTKKSKAQEQIESIRHVRLPRIKRTVTVEDLYTRKELEQIFMAAKHTRDQALVQVLYESAFRASELLSMTFKRVKFDDDGTATVIVNGKTGTREIPLYRSVPALKAWMTVHPIQKGKLWIVLKHKKYNDIVYNSLYNLVSRVLTDAGLLKEKKRIIHMFRHTRATELVRMGVRGIPLQKFMGWKTGDMEQVYVHLSTLDVNNEIRSKVFGIDPIDAAPTPLLTSTKCPRCEHQNDSCALVCQKCNMPLSNDAIVQRLTEKESLQERVDNLEKMLVMMAEKVGVDASVFGLALPPMKESPKKE